MKKILFLDRDGTIIREPEDDYQIDRLEKFSFLPGAISYLSKIYLELDYEFVLISNQDGLGTDSFPEEQFWPYQDLMIRLLKDEGIKFRSIHIDRSFEKNPSPYRKPSSAMLKEYLDGSWDIEGSIVVGDRWSDVELAKNLGCSAILIEGGYGVGPEVPQWLESCLIKRAANWKSIYLELKKLNRKAVLKRNTNETKIDICLDLDGNGLSEIKTGIRFFDHMLEQITRHGNIDLFMNVEGDLDVDEHHTIEDTAIALGEAFYAAMAKKIGMQRYGFSLPMDDCKAEVLLDFGGRPWIIWEVSFHREKIGELPTEMFFHFFKSFSDSAKCNLQVRANGENEHHKIESIFKAFARALRMAISRNVGSDSLPSTKGIL